MPRNRTRSPRGPPPPRKPIEAEEPNMPDEPRETEKIRKSDKEWMRQLTPEQFRVCRLKGTERPFTGKYDACTDKGTYVCACRSEERRVGKACVRPGSSRWSPYH